MVTARLDLQYEGTDFHGWASQPELRTVQAVLEEALTVALSAPAPRLTVAGRTDAGVHARRQVVSLPLPDGLDLERLRRSLDALTPPDLSVTGLVPAPGFDARRDALSRSYRYLVSARPAQDPFLRRYSYHVPYALDWEPMAAAASLVVGSHDLTAFTPTETEHRRFRRTVTVCRWRRRGELAWLEVECRAFLRHMVRVIAGTLLEVGAGRRSVSDVETLLKGAPREAAGPTAPAHGLFLWRVRYPGGTTPGGQGHARGSVLAP